MLLAVTSCQRDTAVRSALARAEAVMEENPGAARQILDSIAYPQPLPKGKGVWSPRLQEGMGEASFALWAMLKTQADYKCYVPLRSDSLARIATDYYGTPRRKNYHAAMAWYTLGCVYTDQSTRGQATAEQAFDAYLKAKPLFPDPTNRYYALCCQNLGRCYFERTLYRDAIREYEASKRPERQRTSGPMRFQYRPMLSCPRRIRSSRFLLLSGSAKSSSQRRCNGCFLNGRGHD